MCIRDSHEPQPISNHPVGMRFPHPAGRYRPGGSSFSSPSGWSCRCMEGSLMRGWELILPEVCWLHVRSPANQRSAGGTGVFTPCGAISTRGIYVFVPRLSELKRCGRISNPEMRWKPILSGVRWLYVRSPANRPGSPVSSPGCRSCKCMEGFMIRGWGPVVPGSRWLCP